MHLLGARFLGSRELAARENGAQVLLDRADAGRLQQQLAREENLVIGVGLG